MKRYLIISIVCFAIAAWAGVSLGENMFFLVEKTTLYKTEREVVMEDYDLCISWTEAVEPECLESFEDGCLSWTEAVAPECTEVQPSSRYKSHEDVEIPYQAYVIDSVIQEPYQFCLEDTLVGEDEEGKRIDLKEAQCTKEETRYNDVIVPVEFKKLPVVGRYNLKDIVHISSKDMSLKEDANYIGSTYKGMAKSVRDNVMNVRYLGKGEKGKDRMMTMKKSAHALMIVKPAIIEETIPHVYYGVSAE